MQLKFILFIGHSVFIYYKIATTLQQAFMIHQLSIKVPSLSSFTLRIKHNQCTVLYGHHLYPNSLYFPQTHSFFLSSFMMNFSPKTYYTFLCIRYLFSLLSQSLSRLKMAMGINCNYDKILHNNENEQEVTKSLCHKW